MRRPLAALALALTFVLASSLHAQGFPGSYEDEGLRVNLIRMGTGFAGTLKVGKYVMPITARATTDGIAGAYRTEFGPMKFSARLEGDVLLWKVGKGETRLPRIKTPKKPLLTLEPIRLARPARFPKLRNLGPTRHDANREWTIVLYIAADNDLEAAALKDIAEMRIGLRPGVEIILLIDRAVGFARSPNDWTDSRVLRLVRPDASKPTRMQVLAKPGELDMGDPDTLASFVEGAFATFPSKRRMVALWDHGGGWAKQCVDICVPTATGTAAANSGLSLVEVRIGLAAGLRGAGVAKLDVIGFDECLMAQLETAVELAPLARYLVASEAIEPGRGWPYDTFLPAFAKKQDVRTTLEDMVVAYEASYANLSSRTTLSALDLSRTAVVTSRLDALLARCTPMLSTAWPKVARALYYSEAYAGRDDIKLSKNATASIDLLDVVVRIRHSLRPFAAEKEYLSFADAHRSMVISSRAGTGRRFSYGVSIYAPPTARQFAAAYRETALGKQKGWVRFLSRLHKHVAADKTILRFDGGWIEKERGGPQKVVTALAGDVLTAALWGNNVIWSRIEQCGVLPDGSLRVRREGFVYGEKWLSRRTERAADPIDSMMPVYEDGLTKLRMELQAMSLMVTDGRTAGTATMLFDSPDPTKPIRVVARYEHPDTGTLSRAVIQFDPVSWRATELIAFIRQPDGRRLPRGIPIGVGGELTLLHKFRKGGEVSWQTGNLVRWGPSLRLTHGLDDTGERVALLRAETMSGRTAALRVPYRVQPSAMLKKWVASWRAYRPGQLAGRWEQSFLAPSGKWQPYHTTLDVRADPKNANRYRVTATFRQGGRVKSGQHVWHITPAAAGLRIVTAGENGTRDKVFYGPAFLLGPNELHAKILNHGGIIWRWRKVN